MGLRHLSRPWLKRALVTEGHVVLVRIETLVRALRTGVAVHTHRARVAARVLACTAIRKLVPDRPAIGSGRAVSARAVIGLLLVPVLHRCIGLIAEVGQLA